MKKPNRLNQILAGKLSKRQLLEPNSPDSFIDKFGKKWLRIPGNGTEYHLPDNGRDRPESI